LGNVSVFNDPSLGVNATNLANKHQLASTGTNAYVANGSDGYNPMLMAGASASFSSTSTRPSNRPCCSAARRYHRGIVYLPLAHSRGEPDACHGQMFLCSRGGVAGVPGR
jgi:hypothetical protein